MKASDLIRVFPKPGSCRTVATVGLMAVFLAACNTTRSLDDCGGTSCVTGSLVARGDIDTALAVNAAGEIGNPATNVSTFQERRLARAERRRAARLHQKNAQAERRKETGRQVEVQSANVSPSEAQEGSDLDASILANASAETGSVKARLDGGALASKSRENKPFLRRLFAGRADPITTGTVDAPEIIDVPDLENLEIAVNASNENADPEIRKEIRSPVRADFDQDRSSGKSTTLPGAIAMAVANDPRVGLARAQAEEAEATVRGAKAALATKVSARVATGASTTGEYDPFSNIFSPEATEPALRADLGLSARRLLFDFKSTRANISRTEATAKARQFELLGEMDNVALEMTDAYLGVLEQAELVALSRKNLKALRELLVLVEANEEGGNATLADVKRVSSRIIESETLLTDLESSLDNARDRYRRLARVEAGTLTPPRRSASAVPPTVERAMVTARDSNPRLLALDAVGAAIDAELRSQRSQSKGRLEARVDASMNNEFGEENSTNADVRGMLVFTTDLYDGGASQSVSDQIMARDRQNDMRYRRFQEELEANLRQYYRAIKTARDKTARLRDGVKDSAKVNELYIDQFQAGKRTIFELLDSQTSLFTAERELIVNQFAEQRANFQIMQATGRLTTTLVGRH